MAAASDARDAPRTRDETLDGARPSPLSRARRAPSHAPAACRPSAVLFDISQLLNTGLDRATLNVLVGMTESGVNPEALAAVVRELRREAASLESSQAAPQPSVESVEERAFAPPNGRLDK